MIYEYGAYKQLVKEHQALYPFAVDSCYDGKIIKKYISNIQSTKYIEELLSSNRNVYEVIRPITRKLYIDIDKVKMDSEELIDYVCKINNELQTHLNVNVSMEDVVILTNPPIDNIYSSVHIIYNTIAMDFIPMKKLIQYINDTTSLLLDDRVYTDCRLFRCINQSKMYINQLGKPLIYFTQHNHKIPNMLDTLISDTKNIKYYDFSKVYEIKKSSSLFKTPTELIQLFLDNKYQCVFEDNVSGIWCKLTQLIYQFPQMYNMNDWLEKSAQISTQYTLDDNLHFLENIEDDDFIYNDENYAYYIINKKIPNQDIHYMRSIYSNQKVEQYLLGFFPQDFVNELMEKIIEPIQKDDDPLDVFSYQNINYVLDRSNCFIYTDSDNTEFKFKINYYYDIIEPQEVNSIESLPNIETAKDKLIEFMESNDKLYILKSSWGTGKTYNILKEAVKRHKHNKILIITSINSLNQTNTMELNAYLTELFHDDVPPNTLFVSHMETQTNKDIVLKKSNKVICSIQSLMKVENEQYDIVFMDEFESLLNGYYGYTTFKHQTIQSLFNTMRNILRRSDKTIVLDADISEPKINLLTSMVDGSYKLYKNLTKSFQSVQFNIHTNKFIEFMLHILSDQLKDKKLVIASATRKKAKRILYVLTNTMNENETLKSIDNTYSELVDKYYNDIKHKTILYIDRDGIMLYKTNDSHHIGTKYTNEEVYSNIDSFIKKHDVHTFIYTPTITTGISVNELYFDKCYGISSNNSVVYNEFIQMLMRVRKFIMNEVNIWIEEQEFKPFATQYTIEHVLKSQSARVRLLNEFNYKSNEELKISMDSDLQFSLEEYNNNGIEKLTKEHYCILQLINMCNLKNTKDNLVFNILTTLKYHKLNIKYYMGKSDISEENIDTGKNQKAVDELDYDKWEQIPFMKFKDFVIEYVNYSSVNKPKPKIHDIEIEHLNKYYKEPNENNKEIYYKSKNIYYLFKIQNTHCKIIQDCFQLMNDPTLVNIYELDTLLNKSINQENDIMIENINRNIASLLNYYSEDSKIIKDCYNLIETIRNSETSNYIYVYEMCDNIIQETIENYNMKAIWSLYINEGKYVDVYKIRSFVHSQNDTFINKLSYTQEDEHKLDKQVLRVLCKHFSIDFNNPQVIIITNKEFIQIFTKIQVELNSLYHYVGDKPIEMVANPKDKEYKKTMFKYLSNKLKSMDYTLKYMDKKNTTRQYDKMVISPNNLLGKTYIVEYKSMENQITNVKRLDEMFPYLQSRAYKSTLDTYKKIEAVDITKLNELCVKVSKNKYLSNKDKQTLCYMLMMYYNNNNIIFPNYKFNVSENANGLDTYKQTFMEYVFKQYYHSELLYMEHDPNKLSMEITYYTQSKNKKVENIQLQNAVVSTYTQNENGLYERSEDKIITRPYTFEPVNMENVVQYNKYDNETYQICSDVINDLISAVCLKVDLAEHFNKKPKRKSVEV